MTFVYRVHVNPEPKDYPTKKEAFRQARNLATACGKPIWVTKEPMPKMISLDGGK